MGFFSGLSKLTLSSVAAGAVVAGSVFPAVGALGVASNKMADTLAAASADLIKGDLPAVATMTDVNGQPIAWLFDQQRIEVKPEDISEYMKLAIISIEDRRFMEHSGVDWRGTARAAVTNATTGAVQQGASTINQQVVKNFTFLVTARTESERRAAIEITPTRKLREIRTALTLDQELSKEDILTMYLNLVPFGNSAFGVEIAARTYFGRTAKELSIHQAALLAGLVQSTTGLNPYNNPEGALKRRNTVINLMVETGAISFNEGAEAKEQPLGILPEPAVLPRGCIASGNRGFYCDYVLDYLARNGLSRETVARSGYTIRTHLDPQVHDSIQKSLAIHGQPKADGVAEVMSVVLPGREDHKVVGIASSREYGLDREQFQSVQPQPFSLVGNGAGSVFKIFTIAAAMEKGLGIKTKLKVPPRLEIGGVGVGGAKGCTTGMYCVENAGSYPAEMSITDLLAQSPNTTFVQLIKDTGVKETMDMAIRLGLRSYTAKGSYDAENSISQFVVKNNIGSFTLGPVAVNGLELSNVGATIASGGMWCPPTPIAAITDRFGAPVAFEQPACEQVIPPGLAHTLAHAMSKDSVASGTAAAAAGGAGWTLPMSGKTGTTESHRSAAFLGFTNRMAASVYAYNDNINISGLCTGPLRQCPYGNLFGGMEPARTWFGGISPLATKYGDVFLPPIDPQYVDGKKGAQLPNVIGLSESQAISALRAAGYSADIKRVSGAGSSYGTVVSIDARTGIPGSRVLLNISDGT